MTGSIVLAWRPVAWNLSPAACSSCPNAAATGCNPLAKVAAVLIVRNGSPEGLHSCEDVGGQRSHLRHLAPADCDGEGEKIGIPNDKIIQVAGRRRSPGHDGRTRRHYQRQLLLYNKNACR